MSSRVSSTTVEKARSSKICKILSQKGALELYCSEAQSEHAQIEMNNMPHS